MSTTNPTPEQQFADSLRFAELGDGIVVLQIHGRGSFVNSVAFLKLAERLATKYGKGKYFFILDLDKCSTMDSTFLGALASIALRQRKECDRAVVVVNANDHTRKLLDTLGISRFVEMPGQKGKGPGPIPADASFHEEQIPEVSKLDRIVHMIETHQKLCEVDSENEARFENVLRYLHESLGREQQGQEG
ncbi:MAG: STAS domain-containing protein [Candidatus Sumerlaeaceae bacterium]|jgi:anti-anti-sigma regulatory factor